MFGLQQGILQVRYKPTPAMAAGVRILLVL